MSIKLIIWLAIAGVVGVVSFFLMPNPLAGSDRALAGHIAMGVATTICLLQLAALWYFLSSLKTFKHDLRKAYYLLSAGLLIFSLSQIQLPLTFIISGLPLGLVYFIVLSPYLFGPLVMYLGVRRFARLLQVHSRWTRVWVAIGVALLVSTIPALLSLAVFKNVSTQDAIVYGLVAWGGGFALAGSIAAFRIHGALSPAYAIAMKRLGIALAVLAATCLHEVIARTVIGPFDVVGWYVSFNLSIWPFLVVAGLMLSAALSFRAVTEQYASLDENASELDVVMYTATLASIPAEIDSTMDKVRAMTALRSTAELSEADKKTLANVYRELEDYLLNKDPLRKFNRQDLRNALPARFLKLLSQD